MKKSIKVLILIVGILFVFTICIITFFLIATSNVKLDDSKIINLNNTTTFYDIKDNVIYEQANGIDVIDYKDIPEHVKNAFIAIEDKRFYKHKGIDYKGLVRACFNNIKSFSFKEGGSTITQQLIKNTHLSNEKKLSRKLKEFKLSKQIEKKYSKNEILEKYLNTIYFGDGCYGISSASKYYFNKSPQELNLNESAILAATIKAPSFYSPTAQKDKCFKRKNIVLNEMCKQGYITKKQYEANVKANVEIFTDNKSNTLYNYLDIVKKEYNNLIKEKPYSYGCVKIYTYLDPLKQSLLESEVTLNEKYNNTLILFNKNNQIISYASTCGDTPRQCGSILKPIVVYAPAIENNIIYSCSPILDEKTNFNGYEPSNYNDKYYGYISAKDALAKSSNVCAVKILNETGVDKAKKYLNKMDIPLTEADNTLCLALGATEKGIKLSQITSAYNVFLSNGFYTCPTCINKITTENGKILYKKDQKKTRVFSDETIDIMNDMLCETVISGTAKNLKNSDMTIYAKTGTVGNKNGNTDAYTISYTSDYVLGVWYGGKDNLLMNNNIMGGGKPCTTSKVIWNNIYNATKPTKIANSNKTIYEYIDSVSYEKDKTIILADENAPLRFKKSFLFKKNNLPTCRSTKYSSPSVEIEDISVNHNKIQIRLCLTELCDVLVNKIDQNGKITKLVPNKINNGKIIITDKNILSNNVYEYTFIPYYNNGKKIIYGNKITTDKIKTPTNNIGDSWWKNDYE